MTGSTRIAIIAFASALLLAFVAAAPYLTTSRSSPAQLSAATPIARPTPTAAPSAPTVTSSSRPKPAPVSKPPAPTASPIPEPPAAAPTTGTLHIESDVADASVFIDRNYLGTAPVTASGLTPGTHHLNMSATGYDGVSEEITVEAGTHDLSIKFKEIKLDAKVAVVHKHAFGSCAGTLVARTEGLRYETTNADDAFVTRLTDLETFEVDYLNKNLRVKLRRGKTYNFTDPDGNADRLFAFHRDVAKARQRLLANGRGGGQ